MNISTIHKYVRTSVIIHYIKIVHNFLQKIHITKDEDTLIEQSIFVNHKGILHENILHELK